MLSQLVYVSKRKSICTAEEIQDILAACERNNPSLGITGVLLYSDDQFIQLVEGEPDTLKGLYDKIKEDDRHENCTMISYAPASDRSFPNWHMGSKKLGEDTVNFNTQIKSDEKELFENILAGKEENSERVRKLVEKFFK